MSGADLQLGEIADEADWRALVEQGLQGAQWARLVGATSDGIAIQPLYREPDIHTGADVSGVPGGAPFIRGMRAGAWAIRQSYAHPDPVQTNADILADLAGGVNAIELVIDPGGESGVAICDGDDLDAALAGVIVEAAPISLDAGAHGSWAAELLEIKLKGIAAPGTAFNLDPLGALMRDGAMAGEDMLAAVRFAIRVRETLPAAGVLRADGRPVHEAGGTEAQEIAAAVACAIAYLRALTDAGFSVPAAARAIRFALAAGADVLIEAGKLRALRLCWARVLEASGAPAEARAAYIHAFTSRRMMTRYDAWTNILRVTTAAFAAAIGGADAITTYPFTDALGLPTPFARRVARNTQHVLIEECRLGHVADPAGGAWFVEHMTRQLAAKAWEIVQLIESKGGMAAALQAGLVQDLTAGARAKRERLFATRRETITGVTDFPLLGAAAPEVEARPAHRSNKHSPLRGEADVAADVLAPVRWASPFEVLRDRAEANSERPAVFCATLGPIAALGARTQFARTFLAAGGIALLGDEDGHTTRDAMIDAFRATHARAAIICGTDAAYAEDAVNAAQRLKAGGAGWVIIAGKPGEGEARLRAAGVDQFVFTGVDALRELETIHAALGVAP